MERYGTPMEAEVLTLLWSLSVSMFPLGGLLGSLMVAPLVNKLGRLENHETGDLVQWDGLFWWLIHTYKTMIHCLTQIPSLTGTLTPNPYLNISIDNIMSFLNFIPYWRIFKSRCSFQIPIPNRPPSDTTLNPLFVVSCRMPQSTASLNSYSLSHSSPDFSGTTYVIINIWQGRGY